MTWADVNVYIPAASTALSVYFLIDILKEFKSFKKETSEKFEHLKTKEDNVVDKMRERVAEMKDVVNELKTVHAATQAEILTGMGHIRYDVEKSTEALKVGSEAIAASTFEVAKIENHVRELSLFQQKSLDFMRALKAKVFTTENEVNTLSKIIREKVLIKKR